MRQTIKITAAKAVSVEDTGLMVGINLNMGLLSFGEAMDPDQAQALGDALLRAAERVQANRVAAGVAR